VKTFITQTLNSNFKLTRVYFPQKIFKNNRGICWNDINHIKHCVQFFDKIKKNKGNEREEK